MFISEAYAQSLGGGGGASDLLISMLPFIAIFIIFYLLILRPQQKRAKDHQTMVENIRRGDTVVTSGGIIGKVVKVDEKELQIELSDGVRARAVRAMIAEVRAKGEPVSANDS